MYIDRERERDLLESRALVIAVAVHKLDFLARDRVDKWLRGRRKENLDEFKQIQFMTTLVNLAKHPHRPFSTRMERMDPIPIQKCFM